MPKTTKKPGRPTIEPGFEPATAENIPEVLFSTLMEFYADNPQLVSAEIRGSKNMRSMRQQYAAEAVGYVQIRRDGFICTVKARVTPEHRVSASAYEVACIIRESSVEGNTITECKCLDCAASQGGCKHGLALLAWLLIKTSQPSVTSTECYWKTSSLSTAVKQGEVLLAADVGSRNQPTSSTRSDGSFLDAFCQEGGTGGTLLMLQQPTVKSIYMHEASIDFRDNQSFPVKSPENFIEHLKLKLSTKDCEKAELETQAQSDSPVWYEVRYGRISASTIYQASRCQTDDGSLVETIMGAHSLVETSAIKRGKRLEAEVVAQVAPKHKKCGVFLDPRFPVFGASPDAITPTHVVEVKCPEKQSTVKNYLDDARKPKEKFYAQIQLQMFMCNRKRGWFGVASPNFETDKNVTVVEVELDEPFCQRLMAEALTFWKRAIFPRIMKPSEAL